VTPHDRLKEKFVEFMADTNGGKKMIEEGFLDSLTGQFWLKLFTAGAKAALELATPTPVRRVFRNDDRPFDLRHDLGGEAGGA
jgi:hypothetical protein